MVEQGAHNALEVGSIPSRPTEQVPHVGENMSTTIQWTQQKCKPCEGGVDKLTSEQVTEYLHTLPEWTLAEDQLKIRRKWKTKDFVTAMAFLQRVAELAEAEDHHPDLHLTGYRHLTIEIATHAIGGLSENDFILAAKIDQLAQPPSVP